MASLIEIGKFIPNIDMAQNLDLLPVAFNACVANRVNKNGDVIDTKTAIAIFNKFINKPINTEHDRQKVIGTVLTAGFSEFVTDKPLRLEEVQNLTIPFNITLGGIVWRLVNPDISDLIEETNDPTSDKYMGISASWELGFSDYYIAAIEGTSKNLAEARLITEPSEIESLKINLKSFGGDGKVDDTFYYRMPVNDVLPLGIGFTEKPAAEVKGVATSQEETVLAQEDSKNIISQNEKINVNEERQLIMKITSIQDITDESIKVAKAADVADLIAAELKKGSVVWEKEKTELNTLLSDTKAAQVKATEENAKLSEEFKKLQATVEALSTEKLEREKVDKFNVRMSEIAENYELDDEVRAAIVEDVKALASDEDFDKWKKKASVLLKGFAKKSKAEKGKEDKESGKCEDEKEEMDSKKKSKASEEVVAAALENANKEKGGLPNGTSGEPQTLKEKYQSAFAKDNFVIKM